MQKYGLKLGAKYEVSRDKSGYMPGYRISNLKLLDLCLIDKREKSHHDIHLASHYTYKSVESANLGVIPIVWYVLACLVRVGKDTPSL